MTVKEPSPIADKAWVSLIVYPSNWVTWMMDGDLDAFAGSWKETPHIWLNDGKGKFTDSPLKLYSPNSDGIAIADVDGDGDLDVLASINTWDGGDGQHKLWLNQIYP